MITKPTYWTEWRVQRMLSSMLRFLETDNDAKTRVLTITELFEEKFHLDAHYLSLWEKKYWQSSEIVASVKRIHKIFEHRINSGALRNQLNPIQVIFNLKNNYGWRDEQFIHDKGKEAIVDQLEGIRIQLAGARAIHVKAIKVHDQPSEQLPGQ